MRNTIYELICKSISLSVSISIIFSLSPTESWLGHQRNRHLLTRVSAVDKGTLRSARVILTYVAEIRICSPFVIIITCPHRRRRHSPPQFQVVVRGENNIRRYTLTMNKERNSLEAISDCRQWWMESAWMISFHSISIPLDSTSHPAVAMSPLHSSPYSKFLSV